MIVYHGTTYIIKHPEISYSKSFLDFGRGFYLTTFRNQAEKWAKRQAMRRNEKAIINQYELSDNLNNINVLSFENENEQWLDFVCGCRRGEKLNEPYDIIIGNVANDDVFKTVDMYFRGIWDKERTIRELRYYKTNNQICIVKQNIIDKYLTFKDYYEVNNYD